MKKIIGICGLALMFLLGACGGATISSAANEQTWPLKIWRQNTNGDFSTYCVVDEDTKVNYVVVSTHSKIHGEYSIAIAPRLNADGSLYIGS